MNIKVFAILDAKVGHFAQPFFAPTIGAAIRSFGDHASESGTAANKHPSDFALYHLGEYDDEHGTFTNNDKPTRIANATDYIHQEQTQPKQLDITEAINRKLKGA